MAGAIGKIGGIPVSMEDRSGTINPQIAPYCHPNINPQRSTGICIGKKAGPAPNMWKNIGKMIPSAMHSAVPVRFTVIDFFIINLLKFYYNGTFANILSGSPILTYKKTPRKELFHTASLRGLIINKSVFS
jgi:hypothetical protein